jgi:hypothetical protein
MNDSKMGSSAPEHLLQGGGKPFETWGGEKPSEVNYQRPLKILSQHPGLQLCTYSGGGKSSEVNYQKSLQQLNT